MADKLILNISDRISKGNLLNHIVNKFYEDFGIIPIIGTEIEFYVIGNNTNLINLLPYQVKPEKGNHQFEIDILPQGNIHKTLSMISETKKHLSSLDYISLHPKPYKEDFGSAMHFHINFLDDDGRNFFDTPEILDHAAHSLCQFLPEHFLIFAPKAYHYERFDKNFMAPTHIAFGGNNRSVAIRTPDAKPKRLEHRVSSPETDEYLAVYAILYALYKGMKNPNSINKHQKIYGNAYDPQYNLIPFPNIKNAIKNFKLDDNF